MKCIYMVLVALTIIVATALLIRMPEAKCQYRQIDYKCLSDCLSLGYTYGYCKSLCSY